MACMYCCINAGRLAIEWLRWEDDFVMVDLLGWNGGWVEAKRDCSNLSLN